MKTEPKAKVFISYSHADRPVVDKLRQVSRLVSVFIDDDSIAAGENFANQLRAKLTSSDVVVFLITPRTFESKWQLQELGAAWALDKPIIAVTSDRRLLGELPVDMSKTASVTMDEIERLPDLITSAA